MKIVRHHQIARLFLLSLFAAVIMGCATHMNEEDRFLWNAGETNAPMKKNP